MKRGQTTQLSDEEREALRRAAETQKRSISGLIRLIVTDWLRANGFLK